MKIKKIFNIKLVDLNFSELLNLSLQRIKNRQKTFIITLNALMINSYFNNPNFKNAVNQAELIIPDGYGIILASKIFKNKISNHIPGIDFVYKLLGLAYENKLSVFLLGSKWDVINKAFVNLKKWFPHVKFVGRYSGYFDKMEEKKIILGINKVNPDILLVGLGSPKQEIWINKNKNKLKATLIIGIGGSFNIISGYKQRAPEIWRKKNLEWLHRSITSYKKSLNLFKVFWFCLIIIYFKITKKYK